MRLPIIIVLLVALAGAVRAQDLPSIRGVYAGTIGSNRVVMTLGGDEGYSDSYAGEYCYESRGIDIYLEDTVGRDGTFTFDELDENLRRVAVFSGQVTPSLDRLQGSWTPTKGGKALAFDVRRIATFDSLGLVANDDTLTFVYPRFDAGFSPVYRALNDSIAQCFIDRLKLDTSRDWLSVAQDTSSGGVNDASASGTAELNWKEDTRCFVVHVADSLVSIQVIRRTWDEMRGRNVFAIEAISYDLRGDTVRRVRAGGIFRRGVDYARFIETYVNRELDQTECKPLLSDYDLDQFVITGRGLLYPLWQYEPSCRGQVLIPYERLRKMIDPNGPLARFLTARNR
jgi:hypothetical protein